MRDWTHNGDRDGRKSKRVAYYSAQSEAFLWPTLTTEWAFGFANGGRAEARHVFEVCGSDLRVASNVPMARMTGKLGSQKP